MPTLSPTAVEPSTSRSPRPTVRTVLRLLGFLSADPEGDLPAAKRACCSTLGFPDELSHDDAALLIRLRPILEARGLPDDLERLNDAKALMDPCKIRCHVAGAISLEGGVKNITVVIEEVNIVGEPRGVPLATTKTTPHGEFVATIDIAPSSLVRARFIPISGAQHTSPSQAATCDMWFEWSQASDGRTKGAELLASHSMSVESIVSRPPRPGRFDICDALLQATIKIQGVEMETGFPPERSILIAHSLATLTRLPVEEVQRHVAAKQVAERFGGSHTLPWVLLRYCSDMEEVARSGNAWEAIKHVLVSRSPNEILDMVRSCMADGLISSATLEHCGAMLQLQNRIRREEWLGRVAGPRARQRTLTGEPRDDSASEGQALPQEPRESTTTWKALLQAAGLDEADLDAFPRLFAEALDDVWQRLLDALNKIEGPKYARARNLLHLAPLVSFNHKALAALGETEVVPLDEALTWHSPAALASCVRKVDSHLGETFLKELEARYPGHAVLWDRIGELGAAGEKLVEARLLDLDRLTVALWRGARPDDGISALRGDASVAVPHLDSDAIEELMKLQRLLRVGQTKQATLALVKGGYASAQEIALESEQAFVSRMKQQGLDDAESRLLWRRAIARYRTATDIYLDIATRQRSWPTAPKDTRGKHSVINDNDIRARIPSIATLFGSQDYADCEACESVVSPAAYLVDLLLWLSRANLIDGKDVKSAYEHLNDRRRDLKTIELTCPNTEIMVPHIDIVCELLEESVAAVAHLPEGSPRQTRKTSEEIRAYPEHLRTDDVYVEIAKSTDPAYWPVDIYLEEIRAYLCERGSSRAEIVRLFGDGDGSDKFAHEYLGLSTAQAALLAAERKDVQERLWGRAPNKITVEDLLRRGEHFYGKGFAYEELRRLLMVRFVAQGKKLWIDLIADQNNNKIDTYKARERCVVGLDEGVLDRMHRLLRLAQATRWTPEEVDAVLCAVANTTAHGEVLLDAVSLGRVAAVRYMADTAKLSPSEFALCFGDFQSEGDGPAAMLFKRTFGALRAAISAGQTLSTLYTTLGGLLSVSPSDLQYLAESLRLAQQSASTTSLALLFRYIRTGETLGVHPRETWALHTLTGMEPFSKADPCMLVSLREAHAILDRSGMNAVQLQEYANASVFKNDLFRKEKDALRKAIKDSGLRYMDTRLRTESGKLSTNDVKRLALVAPSEALDQDGEPRRVPLLFMVITRLLEENQAVSKVVVRIESDLVLGDSHNNVLLVLLPDSLSPGKHTLSVEARNSQEELLDTVQTTVWVDPTWSIFQSEPWGDAFASWLGFDSHDLTNRALETLDKEFKRELAATIAWAMDLDGVREEPRDALATLCRFKLIATVGSRNAWPHLPYEQNPAFSALVRNWSWLEISAFFTYADTASQLPPSVVCLLSEQPDPTKHSSALAQALGIDGPDAIILLSNLPANAAEAWRLVARRAAMRKKLSLSAPSLAAVATAATPKTARTLYQAYQCTVSRGEWLASSARIQNALRPRRRDALAAFLFYKTGMAPTELSAKLLIDIETNEAKDRSRISEACAAVQTFVNRILLGTEKDLQRDPGSESVWNQWFWRKRYSTWFGNRMVYLFPENYLSAGKRSTATPFFRKFQQTVDRGAINEENVSEALISYLSELTEIADLEYLAVGSDYHTFPDDYPPPAGAANPGRVFSVVGRTRGTPGRYYFSQLRAGTWDSFEELALGEDPSQVSLFSSPNQTVLLWPKATLLPRPNADHKSDKPAETILAVKYAFTRRSKSGDWTPVRTTSRAVLYRGSVLTERQLLFQPVAEEAAVRPGELRVLAHFPRQADSTGSLMPSTVSSMSFRRDTTETLVYTKWESKVNDAWVYQQREDDPKTWHGPSPADELLQHYLSIAQVSSTEFDWFSVQPWKWNQDVAVRFDQNRMISNPSTDGRAMPLVTPSGHQLLARPSTPYSITILPWRRLSERSYHPSPWAFFINGVGWSFFVLEKDTWGEEKERGKQGLLIGSNSFGPQQPFAAVPAYHPFAHALYACAKADGLSGIYTRNVQRKPGTALGQPARNFQTDIGVNTESMFIPSVRSGEAATVETIDFTGMAPYALYNMELFFHAPVLVARALRANGQYDQAQRFLHYVFNPLENPSPAGTLGSPWWICAAFDDDVAAKINLETILKDGVASGQAFTEIEDQSSAFDAHKVAAKRPAAYQRYVVMEYIQNLLEWAEVLYRLEDDEDIDEAAQLYSLAAQILGERPLEVPPIGTRTPRCFDSPVKWGGGANVLVPIENYIDRVTPDGLEASDVLEGIEPVHLSLQPLDDRSPITRLYFCVPRNERLLAYWDKVEAGLRNIRTCKTLGGGALTSGGLKAVVDVQALVDAAAAGSASLQQALSSFGNTKPTVRFRILLSKAIEFCNDVRSFGAGILSAIEKKESERLAVIRSTWEGRVLDATRHTITERKTEANAQIAVLEATKASVQARFDYYATRKKTDDLEDAAFVLNIAGAACAGVAAGLDLAATPATSFPNISIGAAGTMGTPLSTVTIGGTNVGGGLQSAARAVSAVGGIIDRSAAMVSTQAGYSRRWDDWQHQKQQADHELKQLDEQLLAAKIRVEIAEKELQAHDEQKQRWEAERDFMLEKYTTEELYLWLIEQTGKVHARAYELAMEMAHRAAESMKFEAPAAPDPFTTLKELTWSIKRRGLLAGEELGFALRQMEADYLKYGKYDCLLTRRLSLRQMYPQALLELRKKNGSCKFPIDAWWLQTMDKGLYQRRIRSVAVSVPCISGPYASVNMTLKVISPRNVARYEQIRLSTGINDYGWDLSSRADSYLPFEGIRLDGDAQTWWHLGFDGCSEVEPSTISDVVLHLEYTADTTGSGAVFSAPEDSCICRCIDLQHDQPEAWQALTMHPAHNCQVRLDAHLPRLLKEFKFIQVQNFRITAFDKTGREMPQLLVPIPSPATACEPFVLKAASPADEVKWESISQIVLKWSAKQDTPT